MGVSAAAAMPVLAQGNDEAVSFPEVYSRDLVIPMTDDAEISKKVDALVKP